MINFDKKKNFEFQKEENVKEQSKSRFIATKKCKDKKDCRTKVTGFTLLEVLLTFLVLGLVLAQIAPKYNTSVQFSRDQAQQANYLKIEGAIELYRVDTGTLPERDDTSKIITILRTKIMTE